MKRTEYKNNTSENALRMFTMKRTTLVMDRARSAHSTKVSVLFKLEGGIGSVGGVKSTHYTKVSISVN